MALLIDQIITSSTQSRTFTTLRDSLLLKHLVGEVRINSEETIYA